MKLLQLPEKDKSLSPAFVKACRIAVLFLCLFIPARNILEYFVSTAVKLIPDLIVLGLFFWYVIEKRFRLSFRLQDLCFLAFLGVAFVNTVFLQGVGLMPFVFQTRAIGVYYILYFVLRNVSVDTVFCRRMLRTLQGVTLVLAALGLLEKIFSKTVLYPPEWAKGILYASNFTRVYSMFENPNTFGLFLVLVFFFTVFFHIYRGISTSPLFVGVLFGMLLLSMSRSSIIALCIGVVLTFLYVLWRERGKIQFLRQILSILVVVAVGFLIYRGAIFGAGAYLESATKRDPALKDSIASSAIKIEAEDRLNQTLTEEELQLSAVSGRLLSLKLGFEVFSDHPVLGTGFGTFGSAASMNYDTAVEEEYKLPKNFYSDNEYIVILVETGAVGTLLFAAFLLSVLWDCRRDFGKFCLCILIGWFGLFYNIFEVQIGAMLLWTFLALPDHDRPKHTKFRAEKTEGEEA